MDWNLKAAPIWDFTELPPQETPPTTLLDGSTLPQRDFSVDLKLGQVSSGTVMVTKELQKVSGPTKRARGGANNVVCQTASSCLVDGCSTDLSNSREYHRRHKVCELHSKTPEVTIGGHKQRFCQQCSRFHSLEEFDEGRRSCRKRLEGHNRRRRKPQREPIIRPPVLNCFSGYQGTSRASSSFSNPNQIYSSAATMGNQHQQIWFGGVNHPETAAAALYNHCFRNTTLLSSSSSHSTMFGGEAEDKSFPLLQGSSSQTLPPTPSRGVSLLSGSSSNHHDQGLSLQVQQEDTDCALSLLSSLSPQMMQPPPLLTGVHQGSSSSSSSATTHCTFPFDDHFLPQTLPFHWDQD